MLLVIDHSISKNCVVSFQKVIWVLKILIVEGCQIIHSADEVQVLA